MKNEHKKDQVGKIGHICEGVGDKKGRFAGRGAFNGLPAGAGDHVDFWDRFSSFVVTSSNMCLRYYVARFLEGCAKQSLCCACFTSNELH